jgi:hypothetical protein
MKVGAEERAHGQRSKGQSWSTTTRLTGLLLLLVFVGLSVRPLEAGTLVGRAYYGPHTTLMYVVYSICIRYRQGTLYSLPERAVKKNNNKRAIGEGYWIQVYTNRIRVIRHRGEWYETRRRYTD